MVCRSVQFAGVVALVVMVAQVAFVSNVAAFEMSRSEYGARLRLTSLPARVRLDTPAPGLADGGQAALLRAIASWNKRSNSPTLLVLTNDDDGALIEIVFITENWQFDSAIAAHTAVESDLFQGDIRRVVIEIDAHRNWTDQSVVSANALDLESVFLHELGHALGLAHASHDDAVMRAGIKPGQTRRQLHDDDVAGISSITKHAGLDGANSLSTWLRVAKSSVGFGLMLLAFVAGVLVVVAGFVGRASKWIVARYVS